jgi:hypothetical protein
MPVIACISSISDRRIARAKLWLESRASAQEVLIVGSNLDAANELARSICQTRSAAFGWHRITFTQLAAVLAAPRMAARGLVSVSGLGVEALVCRAVHSLRSGDALGRYSRISDGPGFARAVAGAITELRLAGVAHEALSEIAPDLLRVLGWYEAELHQAKLTDWPGILAIATETAADLSPVAQRWSRLPMLLLDLPIANQAELSFIAALRSQAPEMLATAPAADEPTISRLREKLQFEIEDLDQADNRPGSLVRLQRRLFSGDTSALEPTRDGQVVVFSGPGESRECVEIARRVLALAREGVAFDRMAVLLRDRFPGSAAGVKEPAPPRPEPVHLGPTM